MDDEFESAFGAFLERREYDEAQQAMFDLVRAAFLAGWQSAGGNAPRTEPVIRLLTGKSAPNR